MKVDTENPMHAVNLCDAHSMPRACSVNGRTCAVLHSPQLIDGGFDEMLVVADHEDTSLEQGQSLHAQALPMDREPLRVGMLPARNSWWEQLPPYRL